MSDMVTGGPPMFVCGPTTGCGKLIPMEQFGAGWRTPKRCPYCGKRWRFDTPSIALNADGFYEAITGTEDADCTAGGMFGRPPSADATAGDASPQAFVLLLCHRFDRLLSLGHNPLREGDEEYDKAFHDAVHALKDLRRFAHALNVAAAARTGDEREAEIARLTILAATLLLAADGSPADPRVNVKAGEVRDVARIPRDFSHPVRALTLEEARSVIAARAGKDGER